MLVPSILFKIGTNTGMIPVVLEDLDYIEPCQVICVLLDNLDF